MKGRTKPSRRLARLEFDHEPPSQSRYKRQILLAHVQSLAPRADHRTERKRIVLAVVHPPSPCSRSRPSGLDTPRPTLNVPEREYSVPVRGHQALMFPMGIRSTDPMSRYAPKWSERSAPFTLDSDLLPCTGPTAGVSLPTTTSGAANSPRTRYHIILLGAATTPVARASF